MSRRLVSAVSVAVLLLAISASTALAGEITGNGRKVMTIADGGKWGTGLHARSECAYSGQEDLQWFQDEGTDQVPVEDPVKGVPKHSQSWGQIPKADREFLTSIGMNPGLACNPKK